MAGIDLQPSQIEFARQHLQSLGIGGADLRVGDANHLPWPDAGFDHVYVMWLLEHVREPRGILREALRVLRPAGTIVLTETDYTSFRAYPASEEYEYLRRAQYDYFARNGNPIAGRMLAGLLHNAGFARVRSELCGFHFIAAAQDNSLRRHVDYVAAFLEPALERIADDLGRDHARLRAGLDFLRALPDHSEGSFTQTVYRAWGQKPDA